MNGKLFDPDRLLPAIKSVIDIITFLKSQVTYLSQGRIQDATKELLSFFENNPVDSKEIQEADFQSRRSLFLLTNEFSCRSLMQKNFSVSKTLIEIGKDLQDNQSCLLSNLGCYYDKLDIMDEAMNSIDQSIIEESKRPNEEKALGMSITLNNSSVLLMRKRDFVEAYNQAKQSVTLLEPLIFADISKKQKTKEFLDKLQVLLIAYFNLGMSQRKLGNNQYIKTIFEQGFKMSKKYLGNDHYFTMKFKAKITLKSPQKIQTQVQHDSNRLMKQEGTKKQNNKRIIIQSSLQKLPQAEKSDLTKSNKFEKRKKSAFQEQVRPQIKVSSRLEPLPQLESEESKTSSPVFPKSAMNNEEMSHSMKMYQLVQSDFAKQMDEQRKILEQQQLEVKRLTDITSRKEDRNNNIRVVDTDELQRNLEGLEVKALKDEIENSKRQLEQEKERNAERFKEFEDREKLKEQIREGERQTSERERINQRIREDAALRIQIEQQIRIETEQRFNEERKIREDRIEREIRQQEEIKKQQDRIDTEERLRLEFEQKTLDSKQRRQQMMKQPSEVQSISTLPYVGSMRHLENEKQNETTDAATIPDTPNVAQLTQNWEDILTEDQDMSDPSMLLDKDIIKYEQVIVQSIIFCNGKFYQIFCQQVIQENEQMIKVSAICEEKGVEVKDEIMTLNELKSVMKLVVIKDILPDQLPIKNIRSFSQFAQICILPFVQIQPGRRYTDDGDETISSRDNGDQSDLIVEIWGRAPGIHQIELVKQFLNTRCAIGLHQIDGRNFRISINPLDVDSISALYLNIQFDYASYDKYFSFIDEDEHEFPISQMNKNAQRLPSYKLNTEELKDLTKILEESLDEYEAYLLKEYPSECVFTKLVFDRTGLIHQSRIISPNLAADEENEKVEFWALRDNQTDNTLEVVCRTHYEVKLSKHVKTKVQRDWTYSYEKIQGQFGVERSQIDRSELIMIGSKVLNSMFLLMPTMDIGGDDEESDVEEEVLISQRPIDLYASYRKLTSIGDRTYPVTMTLLGCEENYLGIKIAIYDANEVKEKGVFLIVDQHAWELSDEQKSKLPKKRKRNVLEDFYTLPKHMNEKGFARIFETLKLKSDCTILWKTPFGRHVVDTYV